MEEINIENKKKSKKGVWTLVIILIVIVVLAVAYYFFRPKELPPVILSQEDKLQILGGLGSEGDVQLSSQEQEQILQDLNSVPEESPALTNEDKDQILNSLQ